MACGCRGRKSANVRKAVVPVAGPRMLRPMANTSVQRQVTPAVSQPSPQLSIQSVSPTPAVTPQRLDADKRRVEKLRRAAIQRALNR